MNENQIGTIIVDCALELHRNLGPGLLETVNFDEALMREGFWIPNLRVLVPL